MKRIVPFVSSKSYKVAVSIIYELHSPSLLHQLNSLSNLLLVCYEDLEEENSDGDE